MRYNFDEIVQRRGTNSYKWDSADDADVLPMWVADMDFRTAPAIIEALQQRVAHGIFGYTRVPDAYYKAVINWFGRRHNWKIQKDWMIYTSGVVPAISAVIKALTQPGDKVLVQTPVYNCFFSSIRNNGCEIVSNPLVYKENTYVIDYEDLERKVADEKVKILLLCNPHNPVGKIWTREELERIGHICIDNGVMIAVDEIHSDLVYAPHKHVPFATISEEFADHCIVCTSPSKTFNLAGLLVSDIIIPGKKIREAFKDKMQPYYLWPGNFGSAAQIAAYNESEDWLEELLIYLRGNAEYIDSFLKERLPEIGYKIPEATYLAWLDFRSLGLGNEELWDLMIHKAKEATDNGPMFGLGSEGYGFQSLNFACSRARLREALERIERAVKNSL